MTNEEYALILDPRREKPGWWKALCPRCGLDAAYMPWWKHIYCQSNQEHLTEGPPVDYRYHGPDWRASDDACFRDWRPVLLAAGYCIYSDSYGFTHVFQQGYQWFGDRTIGNGKNSYRKPILAAVAWLSEHKPELLREAIARVNKGE